MPSPAILYQATLSLLPVWTVPKHQGCRNHDLNKEEWPLLHVWMPSISRHGPHHWGVWTTVSSTVPTHRATCRFKHKAQRKKCSKVSSFIHLCIYRNADVFMYTCTYTCVHPALPRQLSMFLASFFVHVRISAHAGKLFRRAIRDGWSIETWFFRKWACLYPLSSKLSFSKCCLFGSVAPYAFLLRGPRSVYMCVSEARRRSLLIFPLVFQ